MRFAASSPLLRRWCWLCNNEEQRKSRKRLLWYYGGPCDGFKGHVRCRNCRSPRVAATVSVAEHAWVRGPWVKHRIVYTVVYSGLKWSRTRNGALVILNHLSNTIRMGSRTHDLHHCYILVANDYLPWKFKGLQRNCFLRAKGAQLIQNRPFTTKS